jgi:hypothetical protein
MSRFLKTLLLWLLIAALPIQGMAAVVKASCGSERHNNAVNPRVSQLHFHDDGTTPHHHDALLSLPVVDHHDEASTTASDNSASADTQNHHKSSSCSACASCCFGAVAPPPVLSWNPAQHSYRAAAAALIVQFAGYIPAGIERPPRAFSA